MHAPPADHRSAAATTPSLVVDSVTGVQVALPIAGPGARAFAFIVDWHIRWILFVAWYAVAAMIYNRSWWNIRPPLDYPSAAWFAYVVAPSAALYFLYHHVLEVVMRGRTPGKRMAGVRIVTRDGGTPTAGALLTRNVFRIVDSFPVLYGVGLAAVMLTRDHVRIGDLAAGTVLVYDRSDVTHLESVSRAMLSNRLDAASAEVVNDLLHRWHQLMPEARRRLAQRVLAHHASPDAGNEIADLSDEALRQRLEQLARGGES